MKTKRVFTSFFVLAVLFAAVSPVFSQESPPPSDKAKQVVALVDKAAALVTSKGKEAAFTEFRKKGSEWFFDDLYLFAYDLDLNTLLVAAFPKNEGSNHTGRKDANGKVFHTEFVKVVQSKGSGWVDYMFPKPGQTEPSRKWGYVKAVSIDGVPGFVGAGFYPE